MEIFVCVSLNAEQAARLNSIAGDDMFHFHGPCETGEIVDDRFLQCEVVFGNAPPSWISKSENLKWMQLDSVGFAEYVELDWESLGNRVIVSNLAGFFCRTSCGVLPCGHTRVAPGNLGTSHAPTKPDLGRRRYSASLENPLRGASGSLRFWLDQSQAG